jgi:hypothetical protein
MSDDWEPTPAQAAVEQFVETLMSAVRDDAIRECDSALRGDGGTDMHIRWRRWLEDEKNRRMLSDAIPDIVDRTIGVFLNAIDHGSIELGWRTTDGWKSLRDLGDGELGGAYGIEPPYDRRTSSSERVLPW